MQSSDPIGVFDSGVGGLSVLREIRRALPHENLLYVADSAHAPYGDKTPEYIASRAFAITEFLVNQSAKAIVVACNTATGAAVKSLRAKHSIPIVAMEPAIKPAVANSKTKVIGVLATSRTLASNNFSLLFERFGNEVTIHAQACPGLVEQVESGELDSVKTRLLLKKYLSSLLDNGVDQIVLGCTHYPFLTPLIQEIAGTEVSVIDSSPAIARELKRRLIENQILTNAVQNGTDQFWTSHEPDKVRPVIEQLLEKQADLSKLPESYLLHDKLLR